MRLCLCHVDKIQECKAVIGILQVHEGENEPMVAFLCNRPSMYLTSRGWIKDDKTGCIRDPVDILNYCRKVSWFTMLKSVLPVLTSVL